MKSDTLAKTLENNENIDHIANILASILTNALKNAETDKSLFELTPNIKAAFDLSTLSLTGSINPELTLRKTYDHKDYPNFLVVSEGIQLEMTENLSELKKGNFACRNIWIKGKSIPLRISKYGDKIQILETNEADKAEIMKQLFSIMTGDEKEQEVENIIENYESFLEEVYRELPDLLERLAKPEESFLTAGKIMSKTEGEKYVGILEELSELELPLVFTPGGTEYNIISDAAYANNYNPKGLYLSDVIHSDIILDTRSIPIPLLDENENLVGWTIANVLYQYDKVETSVPFQEKLTYSNKSNTILEYNNEIRPFNGRRLKEKKAIEAIERYVEDALDGLHSDYSETDKALQNLNDGLSDDLNHEVQSIFKLKKESKAFNLLADSIKNDLSAASSEIAAKSYLIDFLSIYLAYKIYNGEIKEAEFKNKLLKNLSFIWFTDFRHLIKYLVSDRGSKTILTKR